MKWIEINVGIGKYDRNAMLEALLRLVDPLVTKFKEVAKEDYSWHYLWESNPWSLTLRLRFYGDEEAIDEIKHGFEKLWSSLRASRPDLFVEYCYGRHGECGEEYVGEEDEYGSEGWELVKKMLNFGSEIALELIKKHKDMGRSKEFKVPLEVYVDRYVHLFLDQMAPLINELQLYLEWLIFRYFLYTVGKLPSEEVTNEIAEKIIQILQQGVESYIRDTL